MSVFPTQPARFPTPATDASDTSCRVEPGYILEEVRTTAALSANQLLSEFKSAKQIDTPS